MSFTSVAGLITDVVSAFANTQRAIASREYAL